MLKFLRSLAGNELDRALKDWAKVGKKKFLVPWNRGLGDIALGLYALVLRIKTYIPDAHVVFITRKELEEGFRLLDGVSVITVPWWERGVPIDLAKTLDKLGISEGVNDVIFEKINPTKWLSWQIGKIVPRLKWNDEYDRLCDKFDLALSNDHIGVHVSSETAQFYKYRKDWPLEQWQVLFAELTGKHNRKLILFGNNKTDDFVSPMIVDLRGQTDLLDMLSLIKNRCSILIAPDGGVLSIVYYLDTYFPIKVISLWGDAHQGVLKQGVSSPNRGLNHVPLCGDKGLIVNISVDTVLREISKNA